MDPGTLVAGRFRIEGFASRGSTGAVYRATDLSTDGLVAFKLLSNPSGEELVRFDREVVLLAQLADPRIVSYVAHGFHGDKERPFLVMEWLEGDALSARLASGPLTLEDTLSLATRIAGALAVAHRHGLIHRDVKPGNILLVGGAPSQAKLIDFGIARPARLSSVPTMNGLPIGTAGYMAPEQARGERGVDARADVFALGCVLFKCLAGRGPFIGGNFTSVLAKTLFDEPPALLELRPDAPAALVDLIASMLAKNPGGRPRDGAAVNEALDAVQTVPERRPPTLPPSPPSRRGITGGEQALVSVVLAASEEPADVDSLGARVRAYGAQLTRLANGVLVATIVNGSTATDQAANAARCALVFAGALLGARVALATGRGVMLESRPLGEAIDRATTLARVAEGLPSGVVAIDEVTAGLLDSRFDFGPQGGTFILRAERHAGDGMRTVMGRPTPFVGRARELGILTAIFDACREEGIAHAVVVTGASGIGKSRLRQELVRALRARGAPFECWVARGEIMGTGSPFRMLALAVQSAAGIVYGEDPGASHERLRARVSRHVPAADIDRVARFLGELVGVHMPDDADFSLRIARNDARLRGEQIRRAWEDLVTAECAAQPVLLILEDLHWGDLATVEVLQTTLGRLRDRPFMVLALARPEVRDAFPALRQEGSTHLSLSELSPRASETLARAVLGEEAPQDKVSRAASTAGGNAFFLEEVLRALANEATEQTLPKTVLAMIQARLGRLAPDERRTLRAAAVFGDGFWISGVAKVLGAAGRESLDLVLGELVAKELVVQRTTSRFARETEYVFRHASLREGAYAMLTDEDCRFAHGVAARWLEEVGESDASTIASHFERGGIIERAAEWYARAGEAARETEDLAAVLDLSERGCRCGAAGETLGRLKLLQAEVYGWRGDLERSHARGDEALAELPRGDGRWYEAVAYVVEASGRLGDRARVVALARELLSLPSGAHGAARTIAAAKSAEQLYQRGERALAVELVAHVEAIDAALGDIDHERAPWVDHACAVRALLEGDFGEFVARKEATVAGFERTRDTRNACIERVRLGYGKNIVGQHEQAERVLRDAWEQARVLKLPKSVALAQHNLGYSLGVLGRFAEARDVESAATEAFRAQGDRRLEAACRLFSGRILAWAGDFAGAEQAARTAVETCSAGTPLHAYGLASLAFVLLRSGRANEAREPALLAKQTLDAIGAEGGESLIRACHAEALWEGAERTEARAAIAEAHAALLARASKIRDEGLRRSFLERVPENRLTLELAQEWSATGVTMARTT